MDISDHIKAELIEIKSGHYTKDEVLTDIAKLVVRHIGEDRHSVHEVLRKLREREELGSTGFGNNIAIPHCALPNIDEFVIGFMMYPDGADFESLDDKQIKLAAFIIAPEKKRDMHLRFLSEISGVFRQPKAVEDMFSQLNSVAVREIFLKYAIPVLKDKKQKEEYVQVRIFCQNEKKFFEIIKIISGIKDRDVSVIEGTDFSQYSGSRYFLGRLFGEKKTKFNKIIFAVLPSEQANDFVRKINHVISSLPERKGVLLIMQKIEYINGYLRD